MVFQIEFLNGKTVVHKISGDFAGLLAARNHAVLLMGTEHVWRANRFHVRTGTGGIVERWAGA